MQYNRFFIPLSCEAKGYDYKGKQPAGRCLLEARGGAGKLSVWVQDLKPETLYAVYFIFAEGVRYAGVPVCPLSVDPKGKAEIRFDFEADNVRASGFSLHQCAAVTVMATRAAQPTAALCGYRDVPVPWRNGYYDRSQYRNAPEKSAPDAPADEQALTAPVMVETVTEEPSLEPAAQVYEKKPSEIISFVVKPLEPEESKESDGMDDQDEYGTADKTEEPDALDDPDDYDEPLEPDESPQAEPSADTPPTPSSAPHEPEPHCEPKPEADDSHDDDALQSFGEMARQFHKALEKLNREAKGESALSETSARTLALIFDENVPMYPFRKQNRPAKWVRLSPSQTLPLPPHLPDIFDDPFVTEAYRQYNHLILGITTDTGRRQYILGVPGIFTPEQRPKAVRLGFSQFKCCDDVKVTRGEYGYWLMFING